MVSNCIQGLLLVIITNSYLDPIGSTAMHPSGSVVATCSGQRGRPYLEEDSDDDDRNDDSDADSETVEPPTVKSHSREPDNTLKIWSI